MKGSIEYGPAILLAGTVAFAGFILGVGAFLGGYARPASPTPPTELAEKTYMVEDLDAVLEACEIEDVAIDGASVTLVGADHPSQKRQCFVAEMGATELADRDYSGVFGTSVPTGGEYAWSNVSMSWQQTDAGRDVAITVELRSPDR